MAASRLLGAAAACVILYPASLRDNFLMSYEILWKVPYRSGKVIWSKIGNSKKNTFLKIILVDFLNY